MTDLVDTFHDVEGATPRVVATLSGIDYEIEYVQPELADAYGGEQLDRAYQAMMANQVASQDFSQVGSFGDLESQLFVFENVVVFLFPSSRYEGVFVSFDHGQPFPFSEVVEKAETVSHLAGSDSG